MATLDTFHTYKNDWNYHAYIPKQQSKSGKLLGKCVTFQEALKGTILTGQCFGLNPVLGVCETDATKLRFKFLSWRFLYTLVTIIMQCIGLFFCISMFSDVNKATFASSTNVIFYLTNTCTSIIFLRIAMKWPTLCVKIAKTEAADPNKDNKLVRKCNLSCVIVLGLALFEHILSDIAGMSVIIDCNVMEDNKFELFVRQSFPWIWSFLPYNYFFGLIGMIVNLQCTFNWNFSDLFVICISAYLESRLDQVNIRINSVKNKYVSSTFWRTMREDYNRVSNLVREVDDIISGVVFISFANNLFFICFQLLHTLADGVKASNRCHPEDPVDYRPFRGYEHAVYFVYSFSFLVMRSLAVSLAASKVHMASKAPARALYDVSSSTYCVEIQRFIEQIHGDTVSVSGLQLFHVKRGIILSIAGTIVTYELVLMQFTGISPTTAPITT